MIQAEDDDDGSDVNLRDGCRHGGNLKQIIRRRLRSILGQWLDGDGGDDDDGGQTLDDGDGGDDDDSKQSWYFPRQWNWFRR